MFIYPSNLKARASLLFWALRDVIILVLAAVLGVLALSQTGSLVLLAMAAAYAFLSMRFDETSIMDYLKYAVRFCITGRQLYLWRWPA